MKVKLQFIGSYPCNVWIDGPGNGFGASHFEQRVVRIFVDLPALAETYGHRALRNKSGKCKLASGLVVIERKGA